jgi:hypothetical protein
MDNEQLGRIVVQVFEEEASRNDSNSGVEAKTVFDHNNHRYQLLKHGWQGMKRYFYNVVFVDIKDGLIWIQDDNTEFGIANRLLEHGVSRDQIVLGFQPPQYRKYTEFNPSA